jgi:threonine dehydratase
VSQSYGKQVKQSEVYVQNSNMDFLKISKEIRASFPSFVKKTSLEFSKKLSDRTGANVWLKREDLQSVRSYKIRGAFARMSQLTEQEKNRGVVCASAGNHAQGVALCCKEMKVKGTIFMPETTPRQKIEMVRSFGEEFVDIVLFGDNFDAASKRATDYCNYAGATFIPPFDDPFVIAGQGTVGLEILEEIKQKIDILLVPVGGGGLAAGLSSVFDLLSSDTKIIGVEPVGAPSMKNALLKGSPVTLDSVDNFVDGASVKRVGDLNFEICKDKINQMILVEEGKVCSTILNQYNQAGMVLEPAGALSIAALDYLDKEEVIGKTIVCVVSGGNNDITRTEEIRERALMFEGLKHYFLIRFPQRPGALKDFVSNVLGPTDDITYFQFAKKNNRENGPAVVGVELTDAENLTGLLERLNDKNFVFEYLNENSLLFNQLIG